MARPSPTLLGRPVVFSMPATTTHQKGADSEGIQILRATITILTEANLARGKQQELSGVVNIRRSQGKQEWKEEFE